MMQALFFDSLIHSLFCAYTLTVYCSCILTAKIAVMFFKQQLLQVMLFDFLRR